MEAYKAEAKQSTVRKTLKHVEDILDLGGACKDGTLIAISAIALVFSFFVPDLFPFDPGWIAIVLCGLPIILRAIVALVTECDIKADVLVSLALIASVAVGEIFAAGEVAAIMQLGGLLEELTVARARKGIERLVTLTPQTARIVTGSLERTVAAEEVRIGDTVRVLPGETVPVDGRIIAGTTSINQAVMTGEPLPVDKGPGDEVQSGTINQFGAFDLKAIRVGEDSSIRRMVALVQSADANKARIVGIADRWATWVVIIALSAAALTWIFTGEVLRAVTILVVFCPCALVLATPTAIVAGIGNATKHGFLVREGDALERLSLCTRFAFDKTGTITYGRPEVVAAVSCNDGLFDCDDEPLDHDLLALVASVERRSEHPLGQAIVRRYEQLPSLSKVPPDESLKDKSTRGNALAEPSEFEMIPGRGVSARISGAYVVAGNEALIKECGVIFSESIRRQAEKYLQDGCTIIYAAVNARLAGFVALSDTLRPDAQPVMLNLQAAGVKPVLLTGDSERAAKHMAACAGIPEVHASYLPADKMRYIEQAEDSGEKVCMVGDGINDAPALKRSFVGIALGGIGSDIAVDAADIALTNDAIGELPHLVRLSKHMMRVIRANLTFSMTLNFVAIILAIVAILDPVTGALVHNCGSVFVIVNSAMLLRWRSH